jgi:hypothetical protein
MANIVDMNRPGFESRVVGSMGCVGTIGQPSFSRAGWVYKVDTLKSSARD